MIWISIVLLVLAGIAEHFKDLSEEGKLSGYWDKNHYPLVFKSFNGGFIEGWFARNHFKDLYEGKAWEGWKSDWLKEEAYWWKVHWLQGPKWDWIPVWIRQYLSFRDGWHLLKFFSLNLWALAFAVLADTFWTGLVMFVITRLAFSLPETILRPLNLWNKK